MTTVNDAFINAVLADASYVDDFVPGLTGIALENRVAGRMTPDLAKYVGANFTVLQQEFGNGSSFDATVWRGNAGTPYEGRIYVSVRGTQEGPDFAADGDLFATGLAHRQLVDMVNWWLRATTPAHYEDGMRRFAPQITLSNDDNFVSGLSALATGTLSGVAGLTAVNGHSLGGYLATSFARLFGKKWPVGAVNTFNSAGFSRQSTANIEKGFGQIAQLIGAALGVGDFSTAQNNFYALNGVNVTTNTWDPIGFTQYGNRTGLFQEDGVTLADYGFSNHSMFKLSDLLALGNLLEQLDVTFDGGKLSSLVAAGSNQMAASYEGVLDGLRRLVWGMSVKPTLIGDSSAGNAGPQPASRISFQKNINDLAESAGFKALMGNLAVNKVDGRLGAQAKARVGFEEIAALTSLSPFVVSAQNATGRSALDSIWKSNWTTSYEGWSADKKLIEAGGEAENFTDQYLEDRSMLLQAIVARNSKDITNALAPLPNAPSEQTLQFLYADPATGNITNLATWNTVTGSDVQPIQRIYFDDDASHELFGTDQTKFGDHLYGGGGDDTVKGLDGDDYVDGGTGKDSLDGGKGFDTLVGGAGDDTLNGAEGHDLLLGGSGNDTYQFKDRFGLDTIRDSDGIGKITVDNGPALTGGRKVAENVWESADKTYSFTLIGGNLIISRRSPVGRSPGGVITVQAWKPGQLGITLSDEPVPQTATTASYIGDFSKLKSPDGSKYVLGADGQYVADGAKPNAPDLITGTAGPDLIQSLGGDDAILGGDGDDILEGGEGNDVIMGGRGADNLKGGGGRDLIYGSSTGSLQYPTSTSYQLVETAFPILLGEGFNWRVSSPPLDSDGYTHGFLSNTVLRDTQAGDKGNIIDGGAGDDIIYAGTGNDVVHAGSEKDQVMGLAGDDIVFGDAGDDRIYGDGPSNRGEALVYTAPDQHGRDVLIGGAGKDLLIGQGNDDVLYGGDDDDVLYGDDRSTTDTPVAVRGNDYLDGGSGNDVLYGNEGDDILIGGLGNDRLIGGTGRDIYVVNRGDGIDTIVDTKSENNVLRFASNVKSSDVTLHLGSLMLDLGNGDAIHMEGFDPDDALNSSIIDSFEFADGTALGTKDLMARGFDIDGTVNDDILRGTSVTDRIKGLDGRDAISSGAGDDVIDGGTGDDSLSGGSGNDILNGGGGFDELAGGEGDDVYTLQHGDGEDVIRDAAGFDVVSFAEGIAPTAVVASLSGGLLKVSYGGEDSVTIDGNIVSYRFADGTAISGEEMWARIQALPEDPSQTDGTSGNDSLSGKSGTDYIHGGAGDDTIDGGAGDDFLFGDAGNDTLHGGDGADVVVGGDGNDLLYGDAGADRLSGQAGDDSLYGGEGDDELSAGDGSDLLVGGQGDDLLVSDGAGLKTYRFDVGDGIDVIAASPAARHIQFGAGIRAADIKMYVGSPVAGKSYVRVQYSADDSLLIQTGPDSGALDYSFADLTVLTQAALAATATQSTSASRMVVGTSGNDNLDANGEASLLEGGAGRDTLSGSAYDDMLHGGSGNDTLYGGGGNDIIEGGAGDDDLQGQNGGDTYVYTRGGGNDVITEDGTPGDLNVLRFTDLNAADVTYTHEASGSLMIHVRPTGATIELKDWYADDPLRVQQIVYANGSKIDTATFDNLAQVQIVGTKDADVLTGTKYADIMVGGPGDDTLDGGAGDDTLSGGEGADTYLLRRGMGVDSIQESPGDANTLQLDPGLAFDQLVSQREGNDLHVRFTAARDGVLLKDYYAGLGSWLVKTERGEQKTMDQVVAENSLRPIAKSIEQMRVDWVRVGEVALLQSYVQDAAASSLGYSYASPYSLSITYPMLGTVSYGFDELTQTGDDSLINRASIDTTRSTTTGYRTVSMARTYSAIRYAPEVQSDIVVVLDYANEGSPGSYPIRISYDWTDMKVVSSMDTFTITGTIQIQTQDKLEILEHIVAGPSDNVINTWGMGTVDAGGGNDLIYHSWEASYPPGQFLYGGPGNDTIFGFRNEDVLIGGDGDDYLAGGGGNDTFHLVWGESGTKIVDEAAVSWYLPQLPDGRPVWDDGDQFSVDTVEFGSGITLWGLQITRGHYDSAIDVAAGDADATVYDTLDFRWGQDRSARILVADPSRWQSPNHDGYGIEFFKFADGTVLSMAQMQSKADGANLHTRLLWSGYGSQTLSLAPDIGSITFDSGIAADRITFAKDGADLVVSDKKSFDQWRLTGWYDNPANPQSFTAVFEDGTVLSAAQLNPGNNAPTAVQPISAQSVEEDSAWTFTVPSGAFADADRDAGDTLTLSAKQESGGDLPSWLSFDRATGTFSGTPLNGDVGQLTIKVAATDRAGDQASSSFSLTVRNVNDPPGVARAMADRQAIEDQLWSFAVPADSFQDVDTGDLLTYSAMLSNGDVLPSWLSFDRASRTFSGTPLNADVGIWHVKVTAADRAGANASSTFGLTVANVNDAPVIGNAIGDLSAAETRNFNAQLPANLFADVDAGDGLAWSVERAGGEALPSWLSFDPASRTLSGTPKLGDGGPQALRVTVTDVAGATSFQLFTLQVDRMPVLASTVAPQNAVEDQPWSFTVAAGTFVDADPGDTLTYRATLADGAALPSWLAFNGQSRTFQGTPLNGDVGSIQLKVTATDTQGLSASSEFALTVANVNDPPAVLHPIPNQTAQEDQPWLFVVPADSFSDVDAGDALSYRARLANGASLPGWLSFDAGTRTFSGTPQNADVGDLAVTVVATDAAGANASVDLALKVVNVNDAPVAVGSLAAWSVVAGDAVSYTVPASAFTDVDRGDVLAFRAATASGAPMPSWLAFDPGSRVFSGTPTPAGSGDFVLTVTATDSGGLSAQQTIGVHVASGLVLSGTGGADVLTGRAGNDYLDGGAGPDRMAGGKGDDTYVVDVAADVVTELAGEGVDLVYAGVSYTLPANVEDLTLTGSAIGKPSSRVPAGVTLPTLPPNSSAPGTDATGNELDNVLTGNERKNTLTGGAGNDTLNGGAGDDKLVGGTGNDTYILRRGSGDDSIVEDDSTTGNSDIARFVDDIAYDQLWFRKHGNDLEVVVIGTGDMFSLQKWYKGAEFHVEQFKTSDGKTLLDSQVQNLVDAMASFSPPAMGQTTLTPEYQRSLGGVLAANWH